ncbi:insulinase family protein [Myxococcota bacterium]|nr:insulinase family protein [Myxococcota bacterium]
MSGVGLALWGSALAWAADPTMEALRIKPLWTTLDNGLTVILHEDHRAPVMALSLRYEVGAAEDTLPVADRAAGRTGKAHLFEHLMFEGTPDFPSGDYDRRLADLGADNNAWTDHDATVYQVQGPIAALETALVLEADRMTWLGEALGEDVVKNQIDVVLNERLGDEMSDYVYPYYSLDWLLWPEGHPYRWPVLGTRADLRAMSREELVEHHRRWVGPANATLVLVGDFDAEVTLALVKETLGRVPPSAPPPPRATGVEGPGLIGPWQMTEDLAFPQLHLAYRTVPRGHPDEPALDVLAMVLSYGRGSRLDDALLYRRGLATDVSVSTANGRLGGGLYIFVQRADKPLAPVLRVIEGELDRMVADGPTEEEVRRAVASWRGYFISGLEDPELLADILGECLAVYGDPSCLTIELERYESLTVADVHRVARTYLTEDRVMLSVVGPEDARLALPESASVSPP